MGKSKSIIIGIIAIIVVGGGAYLLLHKSSPAETSSNSSYSSTTSNSTTPQQTTGSGPIIQTKTTTGIGQYLADGGGRTLYTYSGDSSGVSNCSGSCISVWPAYLVPATTATTPANITTIKRADGGTQYAYKGMPLYYFTGDSVGKVTGDGVSNFSVAKP